MSKGNSAAVNVAFFWIQTKSLSNGQVLRSEGFVHLIKATNTGVSKNKTDWDILTDTLVTNLNKIHVFQGQTSFLKSFRYRWYWA